jgi:hypothetical protein
MPRAIPRYSPTPGLARVKAKSGKVRDAMNAAALTFTPILQRPEDRRPRSSEDLSGFIDGDSRPKTRINYYIGAAFIVHPFPTIPP